MYNLFMKTFRNINIEIAHDYFKEIVYQAANLEDKNITYQETYETIEFYNEAIKTIPYKKVQIITSLKKAYEYVIDRANSNKPITYKDAMELNKIIDSYEKKNAGLFRTEPVRIKGCIYEPKIFTEQESIEILNEHKNINSFDKGAMLCAYWSKMQLFSNGNKRTSLCFANLCLLADNIGIIVIKDRVKYTELLGAYYDNESKLLDFIMYLKTCAVHVDIANPNYKDSFETTISLGKTEQSVMHCIYQNRRSSAKSIAQQLNMSERQIQRILAALMEKGNIKRSGSDKTGHYDIVEKTTSK